jgi:rhodanese-related sulfurtransferase
MTSIDPNLGPQPISATTANRRRDLGAVLVDIRPQVPRQQGSITGAIIIDGDAIADRLSGIGRDREIVVCSISSRRAIPTADQLSRLGYHHVYYLDGGFQAWQNRHRSA